MEDWDLQAVVRGCTNNIEAPTIDSQPSCLAPLSFPGDDVLCTSPYDHLFEATQALDELEELYKPFYPVLTSSVHKDVRDPEKLKIKIKEPPTAKHKRSKKNRHRVVKQVEAEDSCSDVCAWRKYRQKPIKGSPYTRSYYKCSSSKGCSTRKQVERSSSNPAMFIITYTAEHTHAHPTHRSPRAGIARSKVPSI